VKQRHRIGAETEREGWGQEAWGNKRQTRNEEKVWRRLLTQLQPIHGRSPHGGAWIEYLFTNVCLYCEHDGWITVIQLYGSIAALTREDRNEETQT
jgi:hypothetical protein